MKKYLFLILGIVVFMTVSCGNTNSTANVEAVDTVVVDSMVMDTTNVIVDSSAVDSVL